MSGLTVGSPDVSLVEGSRLQSPGDPQEDKTCTGTGQKVRYGMQRHNLLYVVLTHIHHRDIHATEKGVTSLVLQSRRYHTHPVRCVVAD